MAGKKLKKKKKKEKGEIQGREESAVGEGVVAVPLKSFNPFSSYFSLGFFFPFLSCVFLFFVLFFFFFF